MPLTEAERTAAYVQRQLERLRAVPRARRQWGAASPNGLLAEAAAHAATLRPATERRQGDAT